MLHHCYKEEKTKKKGGGIKKGRQQKKEKRGMGNILPNLCELDDLGHTATLSFTFWFQLLGSQHKTSTSKWSSFILKLLSLFIFLNKHIFRFFQDDLYGGKCYLKKLRF